MRRVKKIAAVVIFVMVVVGAVAVGREGAPRGQLRGVFLRLVERQVGEREHLGIVMRPQGSDDEVIILVPREPENLRGIARKLRAGQSVQIGFVRDGGERWLRSMDAEWRREGEGERAEQRVAVRIERSGDRVSREARREGERERASGREREREVVREGAVRRVVARDVPAVRRPSEGADGGLAGRFEILARQLRALAAEVGRMQRELRALRAENERLRRQLGDRARPEARRDAVRRRPEGDRGRADQPEARRDAVRRRPESDRERADQPEARRDAVRRRPEGDKGRAEQPEARRDTARRRPEGDRPRAEGEKDRPARERPREGEGATE